MMMMVMMMMMMMMMMMNLPISTARAQSLLRGTYNGSAHHDKIID